MDYFEARYYGSTAGRFISPDPYNIIFEAQATAEINPDKARVQFISYLNHPQQWNRYVYVVNNPLRYIDPTGEQLWLTGSEEEQKAALERIKQLVGEKGAKLLTTRFMDTHVGRVMVVEYTGKDRDALAATSEIGVEIADIIDSNRVVEYRIASSFSYKGRSNVQTGGAICGGACTVGAEESLTGNTQIFVNSKSADFAQELLGSSVRGGLLSNNGRPLDFYDDIVDAHEFGHAYANIIDGVSVNSEQSDRRARQFENVVRQRRGLSNRRVRER